MKKTREEILEDEFVRPAMPGLRKFSLGILKLCQKLELSFAMPKGKQRKLSSAEEDQEFMAACWLLDEANSLELVRGIAEMGRGHFFGQILPDYEFSVSPALIGMAKLEIQKTNAAVEAAMFTVEPKPKRGEEEHPAGK